MDAVLQAQPVLQRVPEPKLQLGYQQQALLLQGR